VRGADVQSWKDYAADGILRDGVSVHVRAIRPDDSAELARGFAEPSPEAVYFRFFRVKRSLADGVFHVTFPTEETPEHAAVTGLRARAAAAQSLRPILEPRAVAVVGASRTPGSIGAALVENLRRAGFTGALYAVNPHTDTVAGLPCFRSVDAIGEPVDLAVVAVPPPPPCWTWYATAPAPACAPWS
jgi:hypothetical protein